MKHHKLAYRRMGLDPKEVNIGIMYSILLYIHFALTCKPIYTPETDSAFLHHFSLTSIMSTLHCATKYLYTYLSLVNSGYLTGESYLCHMS